MKRTYIVGAAIASFIFIFLYFSLNQIVPEEIENAPGWMEMELAAEEASASDKLILVDIYEAGCRFCRQMEREVYPSETIRTLIDGYFHPVKVNGRSDDTMTFQGQTMKERDFALQMGVTAYPFTVVMDADGTVIDKRRGYMGTMDLSRFLNNSLQTIRN